MWPAIIGQNRTNPRPWLPTTRWSLLHDDQESGTMMKLLTLAHRTNWFAKNGTAIYDTTACVPADPYVCHNGGFPGGINHEHGAGN